MHSDRKSIWQHPDLLFQPLQVADLSPHDLEEALCRTRAGLEGYRSLYENTPSVYFVLDLQGTILGINGYGADRLGYAVADLIQQSVFNTFYEGDRATLQAAFLAFVRAEAIAADNIADSTVADSNSGWEFRQVCQDGRVIWSRISLRILPHPHSPVVLFVCEDVTQQRQIAALARLSSSIAQRIRRSLDLDEILKTTVTEIRQFLAVDRVFIYRFRPDWGGVVAVESVDARWTSIQGNSIRDSFFGSPAGREAYQQGRMQVVEDVCEAGLSACHLDLMNRLQVRASLVVPILQSEPLNHQDEQLWGLLVAHHCAAPRAWQPLETELLGQLASQVGIAIQQAELYQQVQRLNTQLEQQVQAQTGQLQQALMFEALLKRITDRVRDTLDEKQILQAAVRELSLGLEVDSCDTALYELELPEEEPLSAGVSTAAQAQRIATIRYEHHRSGVPTTPQRTLPISSLEYDLLLQGQYTQFCRFRARQGWRSVLACPIFDNEGTLGDLWLYRSKEQPFDELEIRLVQQVANQCAIALRGARFHGAMQTQLTELERLNQLKNDFLSTISHELRSPVCNMKMAIQMLEVSRVEANAALGDAARSNRYLSILKNECDREINLVDDLLDLQKLESNSHLISLGAIELPLWLAHLVKPFQERAQARQQQLELHLSSHLPILISDSSRLGRVLGELLNNACKYTPSGERIVVAAQTQTNAVRLSVCSMGVEISPQEQAHVFDKFYRIPRADRGQQSGTGLGLALVKKLTQLLGGKVWVESASNQTCFTVELPVSRSTKDAL